MNLGEKILLFFVLPLYVVTCVSIFGWTDWVLTRSDLAWMRMFQARMSL